MDADGSAMVLWQVVMRDRHTRKPRGFGFITFSEAASAQAACAESHTIDGRQVRELARRLCQRVRNASFLA